MNTKILLKEIYDFSQHISRRGYQKLITEVEVNCELYPPQIRFEREAVFLTYTEKSSHDCPDSFSVDLHIHEIEMTENEWMNYLRNLGKKRTEREEREKQERIEANRVQKEALFNKLKKELGK